jgi:hypothetical protein
MARKAAATDLVKFAGGVTAFLAASKAAGADVEIDPRSTDFGKVKIGRTRIDILGGYQQIVRNVVQQITGTAKNESGEVNPISRGAYALRFGQSKLSPQAGFVADMGSVLFGKGEDLNGRPLTRGGMARQLIEPLSFRDIEDAVREDWNDGGSGIKGLLKGLPALVGVGVNTYEKKPEATLDPVKLELHRLYKSVNPNGGARKDTGQRLKLVGVQTVEKEILPAAINSDIYKTLPSDEAKLEFIDHIQNAARKQQREGYPSDAVLFNSKSLMTQLGLEAKVEASELPAASKQRLKRIIDERFKYARFFEDEKRKPESINRVLDEQSKAAENLINAMTGAAKKE